MKFIKGQKIKRIQFKKDEGYRKPYAENGNLYIPMLVFGGGEDNIPVYGKMIIDLEIPHDVLMEAIQGASCSSASSKDLIENGCIVPKIEDN